ncbi:MAG: hypothetical protein PUA77_01015 [Lachnospiraceae bacterium]|nr:hypothetical protein [Agathobacter sp.]MDD6290361.1 hypothetical protein [Lachnospiraceae bacterium]
MKKARKLVLLVACTLMIGVLAGCGAKFDASKYVQAQMDNSYKNDSSLVVELKYATEEEAQKVYEDEIDTLVDNFFLGVSVSDDVKSRYAEIFKDMLGKAKYTVNESEKQSDGSYTVAVEYQQLKLFQPTMDKLTENADKIDVSDLDGYFNMMADYMEEILAGDIEYGEAQKMDVHIEIVNKTYTLNNTDLQTLNNGLFDFSAVSGN